MQFFITSAILQRPQRTYIHFQNTHFSQFTNIFPSTLIQLQRRPTLCDIFSQARAYLCFSLDCVSLARPRSQWMAARGALRVRGATTASRVLCFPINPFSKRALAKGMTIFHEYIVHARGCSQARIYVCADAHEISAVLGIYHFERCWSNGELSRLFARRGISFDIIVWRGFGCGTWLSAVLWNSVVIYSKAL